MWRTQSAISGYLFRGAFCLLLMGTVHGEDDSLHMIKGAENSGRNSMLIFDFSENAGTDAWRIRDDVVMGGRSSGSFHINDEGHGVFSGTVSLENNGGFSSVRYDFEPIDVYGFTKALIRLKGDGKRYQFRVAADGSERHSYVHPFETSGDWETVEVPLADMYPQFHGRRLDLPNYPVKTMSQVRFLIANGKAESFRLEIVSIHLQ